ncbi:MAG: hypothetical protein RSE33_12245 [Hafnia sp.]
MEIKKLTGEWGHLLFDVRRSVRYHNRRRAFFDRLDQLTNVLALVFGSVSIYGVLSHTGNLLPVLSAGIVTIFSAFNLVIGSSQRARNHFDLARRFIDLEQKIVTSEPSARLLAKYTSERLSIEKDEPPVLRVLDCICYNEQGRAMGFSDRDILRITSVQRLCAPFFDWRMHTIHMIKNPNNETKEDEKKSVNTPHEKTS